MSDTVEVRCPKCKRDSIRLKQVAYGTGEVYEWAMKDGVLEIEDVADPDDPEWEVDGEAHDQFVCGYPSCGWEGSLDDLTVAHPLPENSQ